MEKNNGEIWKGIKDFENYLISSIGNVKSKNYKRTGKEKLLIQKENNKGYKTVGFSKNGRMYYFTIHRLVADAFLPKIIGKNCVNHKNGIKTDNKVNNLEWCTHSENMQHSYNVLNNRTLLEYTNSIKKAVKCVETGETFSCSGDVTKKYGFNDRHINECCNKKRKTANKLHWEFV